MSKLNQPHNKRKASDDENEESSKRAKIINHFEVCDQNPRQSGEENEEEDWNKPVTCNLFPLKIKI